MNRARFVLLGMALPWVFLVFAFNYFPLFGWLFAFYHYQPGIPLFKSEFVGLKYFGWMIDDKDIVLRDLLNTLAMSGLAILCSPISVIFAIFLNELRHERYKKVVQTLTTLPNFISMIIVYSLATFIFSSSGLLNQVMMHLHIIQKPTNVMGSDPATWWFQTAIGVWKTFGFGAIIYLAAIAGIDQELYDAAKVDGAARFQRMWHITVPGVVPTFFVLLLLNIAGILNFGFQQHLVFYNTQIADKIETIDYYTYRVGIASSTQSISYGTAIGMLKSLVSLILLFSVNGLSKKVRGESVF